MKRMRRMLSIVLAAVFIVAGTMNGSGKVFAAGWENSGSGWTYVNNGVKATGWLNDGGNWYYLDKDGILQTGWFSVDGSWYYANGSGVMQTGWLNDGGWYYLNDSGVMVAGGWHKINGYWYHFTTKGTMETGWIKDGNDWYYLSSSGNMRRGWVKSGSDYYYLDRSTGVMQMNKTVNGVKINANGTAEKTSYSEEKLPVMARAADVVESICNPDDSLASKQAACYDWVADFPYILRDYPIGDYYNSGNWSCYDAHYADNILNSSGSLSQPGAECVGEAAALGYLFTELNFGTVYLEHSDVHGWIEVNGLLWDPLNEEANKDNQSWLGITPSAYGRPTSYHWVEI